MRKFDYTGANSGIGFELVKSLNSSHNNILAFVNNNDENLKIYRIKIYK